MRPSKAQWALDMAIVTSHRATCARRQVGCVLLNWRGHVLSTGYNGVAAGQRHCNEEIRSTYDSWELAAEAVTQFKVPARVEPTMGCVVVSMPHACPGAQAPSGTQLDACQAIHAEQNALLQCHNVQEIHTCYVTTSPCITCVKLLLNTSCQQIVFLEEYSHMAAKDLWVQSGRGWIRFNINKTL